MRTVVYDAEDYEPITVIDVPASYIREIEAGRRQPRLVFPVYAPLRLWEPMLDMSEPAVSHTCEVMFEPIHRGRGSKRFMWLCTTTNGETALLLSAAFLPGQRGELNERLRQAFMSGLLTAMA